LILSTGAKFKEMKDYRDCLQHYTPVSAPISHGILKDMGEGIRGCHLPLPDNPTCRSMKGFIFDQDIDALTYCWESTNSSVLFFADLAKYLWTENK